MLKKRIFARRDVVHGMAAAGVVGMPLARLFSAGAAHAAAMHSYDPNAQFDLSVSEVELKRNSATPCSSIHGRAFTKATLRRFWNARRTSIWCRS